MYFNFYLINKLQAWINNYEVEIVIRTDFTQQKIDLFVLRDTNIPEFAASITKKELNLNELNIVSVYAEGNLLFVLDK